MLSQRARYALKALIHLAGHGGGPLAAPAIAEAISAPPKFLEIILRELKASGLIASTRGRSGGFALARPADAISLGDILRATDGPIALVACASRQFYKRCDDCDETTCALRRTMVAVRDRTAALMDGYTLAEAAR
ncbi:MAG: Rrf2 family transcriptional regulator [Alphaproteobacteria bacterium]|nr:Rrf2 family transcriptional regulator [Alphaproteobacteria bacterium]